MLRLVLVIALAGCTGKSATDEQPFESRVTERSLPTEGMVVQEVDFDADGISEVFNYFRERIDAPRLLMRKELDLNRDGKIDVVSYFDELGKLEKEEMDSDYDGRFDWTDHYQEGVRVMSEYDTDYDGIPNVFKYFERSEDGAVYLDRKERDSDGDGLIDVWERFSREGEVVRTGRDTDGDGKMDVREE